MSAPRQRKPLTTKSATSDQPAASPGPEPDKNLLFCMVSQGLREAREARAKDLAGAESEGSAASPWGVKRRKDYVAAVEARYRSQLAELERDPAFGELVEYCVAAGVGDPCQPTTDLRVVTGLYVEAAHLLPNRDASWITLAEGLAALRKQDEATANWTETVEKQDALMLEQARRADATRHIGIGWVAGVLRNHAILSANAQAGAQRPRGVHKSWYDRAESLWAVIRQTPGFDRLVSLSMAETGAMPTEEWVNKIIGALAPRLGRSNDDVWYMTLEDALVELERRGNEELGANSKSAPGDQTDPLTEAMDVLAGVLAQLVDFLAKQKNRKATIDEIAIGIEKGATNATVHRHRKKIRQRYNRAKKALAKARTRYRLRIASKVIEPYLIS